MRKGDSMGLKLFPMKEFDELKFLANIKSVPGLMLGKNSLTWLWQHVNGMRRGFQFSGSECRFEYLDGFEKWYLECVLGMSTHNCYTYILDKCGGDEAEAFVRFFREFEKYLKEYHGLELPVPEEITR